MDQWTNGPLARWTIEPTVQWNNGPIDDLDDLEDFPKISQSVTSPRCPMECLNLSANQLSIIEPELLADAVNCLGDVTLLDTGLSLNQV